MKYLFCISLLVGSLKANAFVYTESDKNAHYVGSLIGTTMISHFYNEYYDMSKTETYLAGFTTMIVLGIFKESLDKTADKKDIEANILGGLSAIPILYFTF